MRARLLLIAAAVFAPAAAARADDPRESIPCPRPAGRQAAVYTLRNVAAEDVARAVNAHLKQCAVTAEPVTNTVLVSGDPAQQRRVAELLAAIDRAPTQVMIQGMVVQVPAGFTKGTGLAAGDEAEWVISGRELRMVVAHIREAKQTGKVDVLSRPALQVADNQAGFVQVGNTENGISIRMTPRCQPDGKVLLRAEPQVRTATPGGSTHVETIQTSGSLADGETLVIRGPAGPGSDGEKAEVLYLLTVHVVKGGPTR